MLIIQFTQITHGCAKHSFWDCAVNKMNTACTPSPTLLGVGKDFSEFPGWIHCQCWTITMGECCTRSPPMHCNVQRKAYIHSSRPEQWWGRKGLLLSEFQGWLLPTPGLLSQCVTTCNNHNVLQRVTTTMGECYTQLTLFLGHNKRLAFRASR